MEVVHRGEDGPTYDLPRIIHGPGKALGPCGRIQIEDTPLNRP
jgi:hypothetical protein